MSPRTDPGSGELIARARGAERTWGVCYVCPFNCPTEVFTRDGRVVYVRGNPEATTKGSRCVKGEASTHLASDETRLKYPLRRTRSGEYERISWDAAFDLVATELGRIKARWGPEAVVYLWHVDPNGIFAQVFLRDCYGTPNYYGHTSACEQDRRLAALTVFGHPFPVHDYEHARHVMLLGINMLGANQNLYESRGLVDALAAGARLVVVDPALTATAAKAHEWVPIAPGTDGALLLAMAHTIVTEGLYDEPFCRRWTHGFEEFCRHVVEGGYTPEWAETITTVEAGRIRRLAREFATTKPALMETFKGLGNYANGLDASRTVYILNALTGQVDGPGNLILKDWAPLQPPVRVPKERRAAIARPPLHVAMGYPLAPDLPTQLLPDAVLEGRPYPVTCIFFQCTNPLMSEPNTRRYREMLRALEFSVAIDTYMSETAAECALVLPEASFYERAEVRQGLALSADALLCTPALPPFYESKPLYDIVRGVAERMGFGDLFRWERWEEWAGRVIADLPVSLDELRHRGFWQGPLEHRKFERHPLPTPSGKIELYAESFARHGYDPLPGYRDRKVIPDAEYPFQLINTKLETHCNLTTQESPLLLRIAPENWAELNTEDARALGIEDGDRIELVSPLDRVVITARVRPGIRPGVVCVRHGHGFGHWQGRSRGRGAHVNPLIGTNVNPISGGIGYNECKVRVTKLARAEGGGRAAAKPLQVTPR
ncbi:MAG: molybdopterin-dependent oxidoreductase [Candidatus Rokubacteria bacterium]|nr:molybdopterin-dependent oxidoreductase [Candidatus Rokubacteria bacterium]